MAYLKSIVFSKAISQMSSFILNLIHRYLPTCVAKKLSEEMIRFIIVGIANNVFTISIFQILLFFMDYKFAVIIVYLIGFFMMFFGNALYVFKNANVKLNKGVKYFGFYIVNLILNYSLLVFFSSFLSISPRIGVFIVLFCTTALSFIISRKILKV